MGYVGLTLDGFKLVYYYHDYKLLLQLPLLKPLLLLLPLPLPLLLLMIIVNITNIIIDLLDVYTTISTKSRNLKNKFKELHTPMLAKHVSLHILSRKARKVYCSFGNLFL